MHLTQEFVDGLRESFITDELLAGEVRRIEGAGELYIALNETVADSSEYIELYELFIDEIGYKFYRKNPAAGLGSEAG